MPYAPHIIQSIVDATGKAVTILAKEAGIDPGGLSKVKRGELDLTVAMLESLIGHPDVPRGLKAALAIAFIEDKLPECARELVLITARHEGLGSVKEEASRTFGSEYDKALHRLDEIARSNPAMARAIKNLVRVYEGRTDVVE